MNQNDYVILFDEKGTPYIAHAAWLDNARNAARNAANAVGNAAQQVANRAKGVGRGVRTNHKYILKVNENGKTRYFYKQEEVKAYYEAKRKGIKNPAEYAQKAANVASNAVDAAKNAASSTYNKAKDAANNTVSNAKNAYERMKGEFRDRAEQVTNAVKEASGINARNNVKATQKALDDANTALSRAEDRWWADAKEAMAHPSDKTEAREKRSDQAWSDKAREREQADEQARDARIAYSKTPLAKAEKQVKNAIDTAKDIAGYDERERRDAAKQVTDTKRAEGQTPTVTENTRTAQTQKAYNKTPLGMIENAKNVASSAANAAKNATSKAGNAAKSVASKAIDKAKDIAGYDERDRRDAASDYAWDLASKGKLSNAALDQQRETEKQYRKTPLGMIDTARDKIGLTARKAMKDLEAERDEANISNDPSGVRKFNADSMARSAKAMYQETPLGKLESFAANPRTTVKESVQGMIDNARSSTAKAVNEAWDKIPKNADGTVNPFDPKFQSTYNDWKNRKDKYDSSLTGRAKEAAEKVTDSVMDMIDQAKKAAKNTATSAQKALDNATGNNYRKRAQEANQAAENAINQRARTSDQLENQRSKYGSKTNDSDHIYGDSEGYYYKTKEQRDRAESLISKRDRYDADIVNNNRASKVNDSMYADSKAGKINSLLGRETSSTSERANSKATEVNDKWDRQEAESKLIGGRLDPGINVSKEYVYSRASNSGMAGEVRQVKQLEEAMRSAERAYERLSEDSSKPQSSSKAARQKMLQAQDAYEKAYEELIDDINDQYDRDLAEYERRYGKYNRG